MDQLEPGNPALAAGTTGSSPCSSSWPPWPTISPAPAPSWRPSGPTGLVGHSYGGSVITAAGAGAPHVLSLVYTAAFAPDQGQSSLSPSQAFLMRPAMRRICPIIARGSCVWNRTSSLSSS